MEIIMICKKTNHIYCPICENLFESSLYLNALFSDDVRLIWLSNMVMHYRHTHITSWNKCWGPYGFKYKKGWFGDYETEKYLVNERAKRQIIRKCTAFLMENHIDVYCFNQLKGTNDKTKALAIRKLHSKY